MVNPNKSGYVDWDRGRQGYDDVRTPIVYAPVATPAAKPSGDGGLLSIRREERMGSLIAAGGLCWAVYVGTVDYTALWRVQIMPPGPVEICALGILAWLHAKWRRSAKPR